MDILMGAKPGDAEGVAPKSDDTLAAIGGLLLVAAGTAVGIGVVWAAIAGVRWLWN